MRRYTSIFFILLLLSQTIFAEELKNGMVVSEKKIASQVGAQILQSGGNAIDAAVAVGYALAVVNPCCGNIGGGGFATIHFADGRNLFLNFREKAPLASAKDMFDKKNGKDNIDSLIGYRAVAVPGTVLGLETLRERFGKLSRADVIKPAIKLANDGYEITDYDAEQFADSASGFAKDANVAAIFLHDGKPYEAGETLKQKDLANSLSLIAKEGPKVFYHGTIADKIVKASKANGGILSQADFAKYNVEFVQPIHCTYRGYTIVSAPPPSSGGTTLCEMLNILENFPLKKLGYRTPQSTYVMLEAMRYAYTDRNNQLGDPNFVKNPVDHLISKTYAREISARIKQKLPAPTIKPVHVESIDTTHYSVVDKDGNAVAVTYTLNGFFGAEVIADHTGFFLNDEMDDFATVPNVPNKFGLVQSDTNAIAPGKRPLSSMTPTIVMKDGNVEFILGSPGGSRIITAILLTLTNVIDYDMPLNAAVNAPRFHFQALPDAVELEPASLPARTIIELEKQGFHFNPQRTWASVEAIRINSGNGHVSGVNDYRRPDGAAIKAE